jgi:hypothetical protein
VLLDALKHAVYVPDVWYNVVFRSNKPLNPHLLALLVDHKPVLELEGQHSHLITVNSPAAAAAAAAAAAQLPIKDPYDMGHALNLGVLSHSLTQHKQQAQAAACKTMQTC